jgi:hypothetical protein
MANKTIIIFCKYVGVEYMRTKEYKEFMGFLIAGFEPAMTEAVLGADFFSPLINFSNFSSGEILSFIFLAV